MHFGSQPGLLRFGASAVIVLHGFTPANEVAWRIHAGGIYRF